MIYLDTAALVKLVRRERGTTELIEWLAARAETPRVTSVLAEVELQRALRRSAPTALDDLPAVLGRMYTFEIDAPVRVRAATYEAPTLRTLDAIHLATAELLGAGPEGPLVAFVTYDARLLSSAADRGLPTASPGA